MENENKTKLIDFGSYNYIFNTGLIVGSDYLPSDMSNKIKADRACTQMNRQNRVGFFCGKDSNYFSAFIFFKDHIEERKNVEIVIHSIDANFIKGISKFIN